MNPGELKQKVKQVLWQQRYAVLATCKGQEPTAPSSLTPQLMIYTP
jgi:hypothetical protein